MKLAVYFSALALGLAAVVSGVSSAQAQTVPTAAALDSGYAAAIQSDGAASTYDPYIGREVWATGDVTAVDGTSTVGYYGYPHGAFVTEVPGSTSFTVLNGKYGPDYWGGNFPNPAHYYQQVPNWSDGTYFWMILPVVEGTKLHVIGVRIQGVDPFSVVGSYDAVFNAATLAYQGIYPVPAASGDAWSGIARGSTGWWLTSQHGNAAYVPSGKLATGSAWQLSLGAVPASAGSWPVRTASGWHLFSAQVYGTQLQVQSSASMTGPWSAPVIEYTLSQPQADGGIIAHPDLPAPVGDILVNYDVNDSTTYDPEFAYVAK